MALKKEKAPLLFLGLILSFSLLLPGCVKEKVEIKDVPPNDWDITELKVKINWQNVNVYFVESRFLPGFTGGPQINLKPGVNELRVYLGFYGQDKRKWVNFYAGKLSNKDDVSTFGSSFVLYIQNVLKYPNEVVEKNGSGAIYFETPENESIPVENRLAGYAWWKDRWFLAVILSKRIHGYKQVLNGIIDEIVNAYKFEK